MSLLFHVLFEHWEAADLAAERAWLNVWRKLDERMRGVGSSASEAQIARAFVLRCEANELLDALCNELRAERERVPLL